MKSFLDHLRVSQWGSTVQFDDQQMDKQAGQAGRAGGPIPLFGRRTDSA